MSSHFKVTIQLWEYFNHLSYYDTEDNINYLFLIHANGIIKYNLDNRKISKKYFIKIPTEYMTTNECCLDEDKKIIYMHIFHRNSIISFNFDTEQWNHDYCQLPKNVLNVNQMMYIPSTKEVLMLILLGKQNYEVWKLNQCHYEKKQLEIPQNGPKIYGCEFLDYGYLYIYALQQNLKIALNQPQNINIIIRNILKIVNSKLPIISVIKHCYIACNQLVFIIFQIREIYEVYCIDILHPTMQVYLCKSFPEASGNLVIDHNNDIHTIDFFATDFGNNNNMHNKICWPSILPNKLIQFNKIRNEQIISGFCKKLATKYRMNIPHVFTKLIILYFPLFNQ